MLYRHGKNTQKLIKVPSDQTKYLVLYRHEKTLSSKAKTKWVELEQYPLLR
jgi:hypothetical protein